MRNKPRKHKLQRIARAMLQHAGAITPHAFADRAGITWGLARDILRELAKRGDATALVNGRFGKSQ
jgi:ribosomal protein S25